MTKPEEVLAAWDARIAGTGPLPSQTSLIEALRAAIGQRDSAIKALQRIIDAQKHCEDMKDSGSSAPVYRLMTAFQAGVIALGELKAVQQTEGK